MTDRQPAAGRVTPLCGGKRRQGEGTCRRPAGWGTDHVGVGRCKLHGGATSSHRKAAKQQIALGQVGEFLAELQLPPAPEGHEAAALAEGVLRARKMALVLEAMVGGLDDLSQWAGEGGRQPHVLVDLLGVWSDRAMRGAKLALDAGVQERQISLAEQQGEILAGVLRGVLAAVLEALAGAGVGRDVLEAVWRDRLPGIVRAELGRAVSEGGEAA